MYHWDTLHRCRSTSLCWTCTCVHLSAYRAVSVFAGFLSLGREGSERAKLMLKVYADFAEQYMAVPVVQGVKSETERFAGALDTYTIEAMMQDGKALQSGTSHFLGQNFGKAFNVQFINKDNNWNMPGLLPGGVSTV